MVIPSNREVRLVSVGRLEPNKGIFDAIRVTQLLRDFGYDAHLYWAGQGTLERQVERFLSRNKISHVHLLGALSIEERNRLLQGADLVVVTSYAEGFNLAIGEALLREIPVVAYELPVYRDVYQGYVNYVELGDMHGMAKEIQSVISNYEKAKTLARRGRQHILEHYTISRVVERLEKLFLRILS